MKRFHCLTVLGLLLCAAFEPARVNGQLAESKAAIARDETGRDDPQVRRLALNALGEHAGAVIVMNPKNGRVLTIINQEWAVRRSFKPCSLSKIVTGLAGLDMGLVAHARDATIAGRPAPYTFSRALAASDNDYFETLGAEIGAARWRRYAQDLGFGQRAGINLTGEIAGGLPAANADPRLLSSHGAGLSATPLQLAVALSAIANGGALVTPRLGADGGRRRRLSLISAASLRQMLPGLTGAVQLGTGRPAYDAANRVAGKTGTCDDRGLSSGLFASFAPVANPKLAIVVVLRGASENSGAAASIAGRIYRALKGRFGASRQWVSGVGSYEKTSVPETRPRPKTKRGVKP
jgi:cell division protein FtsI/penicillin-binding protein 2